MESTNANISQGSSPTTTAVEQELVQKEQTTQVQQTTNGAANGTNDTDTKDTTTKVKKDKKDKKNKNKDTGKHTKGEWYDQGRPTGRVTIADHLPGAKEERLEKERLEKARLEKERLEKKSDATCDDEKMFSRIIGYMDGDVDAAGTMRRSISDFDQQQQQRSRGDGLTQSVLLLTLMKLLSGVTSVLGLSSPAAPTETASDETAQADSVEDVENDAEFAKEMASRNARTAQIRRTLDEALASNAEVMNVNTGISFENHTSGSGFFYSLCALFFVSGGKATSDVIRDGHGQTVYPVRLERNQKYPYKASADDVMGVCQLTPLFSVPLSRSTLCDLTEAWVADYFRRQLTEDQLQTLINSLLGEYKPSIDDGKAPKFYLPMKRDGHELVIAGWVPLTAEDAFVSLHTNRITTSLQSMVIPPGTTYFTDQVIQQVSALGFHVPDVKKVSGGLNLKMKNPISEMFLLIVAALQSLMNTRNHELGGAVAKALSKTLAKISHKTGSSAFNATDSNFTYAVTLTLMCALNSLSFTDTVLDTLAKLMKTHSKLINSLQDLKKDFQGGDKDSQELKKGLVDALNSTVCSVVETIVDVLHARTLERRKKNEVTPVGDLILDAYLEKDLLRGALLQTHKTHLAEMGKSTQLVTSGRGGRGGDSDHVQHTSTSRGASAAPQLSDTNLFPALPTTSVPRVTVAAPAKPPGKPSGKSQKIPAAESRKNTSS
jgi:hypothetical protein